MKKTTDDLSNHHCTVLEQKRLVSKMTQCDTSHNHYKIQYECYLKATKENRENNACMFS